MSRFLRLALLLVLAAPAAAPAGASASIVKSNPFQQGSWWVDSQWSPGARLGLGNTPAVLRYIGRTPQSKWMVNSDENQMGPYLSRVPRSEVPTFAIHNLAHQYCGGYNPPVSTDRAYKRWVGRVAGELGSRKAIIFVEPDGLPAAAQCMTRAAAARRVALIGWATRRFAKDPNAGVYIDAGSADWRPARQMAAYLAKAGVRKVRGFSLNVTHYDWAYNEIRYGKAILKALAKRGIRGKHFVVNTAYSGLGPLSTRSTGEGEVWCDPPGRAIGPVPTTQTPSSAIDAFFWIGNPGKADNCADDHSTRGGYGLAHGTAGKNAGEWAPVWANDLVVAALTNRKAEYPTYRGAH